MDSFLRDLKQAIRALHANKAFTIVAGLALALGIGANTAIFSVVDAVLLKPLPYPDAERILTIHRSYKNGSDGGTSVPKYMAWRAGTIDIFDGIAAYDFSGPGINLTGDGRPEQARGIHVAADYFRVFGAVPAFGRTFTPDEDQPGGGKVVVLSVGLWKRRYGADPAVVGRAVLLNGEPHVVVGVLNERFRPDPKADLFVPLQADPASTNQGHYLRVAARLKPGVTLATAQGKLKAAAEDFRSRNPNWINADESAGATPMREWVTGDVRQVLLILFGAVGLVLLIACSNVANLLLARGSARQREIAVRAAIGASRGHIVRQLLAESMVLAIAGGTVGLILGAWGVRALLTINPGNLPRVDDLAQDGSIFSILNGSILVFTMATALLTGLLFGLFPALQLSKPDLNSTLKEASGRGATNLRSNRARGLLVVGEMAMALVLLAGAVLLIRTFVELRNIKPGFDPNNLLTLQLPMGGTRFHTAAAVERFNVQVAQRVESLPGVLSASATLTIPIEGSVDLPFSIEGRPNEGKYAGNELWVPVGPHYFETMGIPLLRGRRLNDRDTNNAERVALINDAMAKKYWPDQDPIGRRIVIAKGLGPEFEEGARTIVGIVGDTRERGLEQVPRAAMYLPLSQITDGLTRFGFGVIPLHWVVKTRVDPQSLAQAIQREINSVDKQVAAGHARTMRQVIGEATARQNFNMQLLTLFAGVALALSAIGIYGLISYNVAQRSHEIGIRMALGAGGNDMMWMVVRQGMTLALAGAAIGVAGAFGLTRLLSTMLFGVKASDPATFVLVTGAMLTVALAATAIPAWRATKVDPVTALRSD